MLKYGHFFNFIKSDFKQDFKMNNKLNFLFSLCIFVFACCVHPLFAQQKSLSDSSLQVLESFIQKEMKQNKIVGLSVALVDDQKIIWKKGFGYSDKAKAISPNEKTVYRVGSISKPFLALALMQLVEQGKLDLDAPIQQYIPELKIKSRFKNAPAITTRHILSHHSGLPSDILVDFFQDSVPHFSSIVDFLNQEYVCFPPNFVMAYSNAGYALLGKLVENISQEDFHSYTQKHLFEKMKMQTASYFPDSTVLKYYSKGYKGKKEEWNEPPIRDVPAGMLHASVSDISQAIKMLFADGKLNENQILKKETLAKMFETQNEKVALDFDTKMGLSWFKEGFGNHWEHAGGFIGHGGDTRVYHSELFVLPKQKLGVVVLTNSQNGNAVASEIAKKILDVSLEELKNIKRPEKEKSKIKLIKKSDLEKYNGTYLLGVDFIKFEAKKGKLKGKLNNQKAVLIPNNQNTFTPRLLLLGFIPITLKQQQLEIKAVSNTKAIVIVSKGDRILIGNEIKKSPINKNWKKYLGKYEFKNADEMSFIQSAELKEKDGFLVLKTHSETWGSLTAVFKTISDTQAIDLGIGRNRGYTLFLNPKEKSIRLAGITLQQKNDKAKQ